METDSFVAALLSLMEKKYGMPLHEKLGMSPEQCRAWLKSLGDKNPSLRDAQQTIETVVARKGEQDDPGDFEELLHYI
jgi:hypothetical protein